MSEEKKQLDLANLSEKLHLFICPLFTETNDKKLNQIEELQRPRTDAFKCVRYRGNKALNTSDPATDHPMATDIAKDFNEFVERLKNETNANWDIEAIKSYIGFSLDKNCSVFSQNSCWFHIDHPDNNCVFDFAKQYIRKEEIPGIVFGYYDEQTKYTNTDVAEHLFNEFNAMAKKDLALDRIANWIDKFRQEIDPNANMSDKINRWVPSLEVSLRIPIQKPTNQQSKDFVDKLGAVREHLNQISIGIFDEDRMHMHYLGKNGWKNGSSKYVKPDLIPTSNRNNIHSFLLEVSKAVTNSASIIIGLPDSVHDKHAQGTIIPANYAYLRDLLKQSQLGFSFFPPAVESNLHLGNMFLLEGGRWLWDSVFPYKTKGIASGGNGCLYVLLDTVGGGSTPSKAIFGIYQTGSTCVCGRCYPVHQNPGISRSPLGNLRISCPQKVNALVDAGDPEAVLMSKFGSAQDAGLAWESAMTAIS